MKKLILVLIVLIIIPSAFASDIDALFDIINRDDGLSNMAVSAIVQDKHGYLWLGTQGGLNRYDGQSIKVFRHDPFDPDGLLHNVIQTLYYDETEHKLLVGTYQGLSIYDIDSNTFEHFTEENGLINEVIISIEKDPKGNYWLGTMKGLYCLRPDQSIEIYNTDQLVRDLLYLDDVLYVATQTGLYIVDPFLDQLAKIEIELPSPYLMDIVYHDGFLVMGLWDGGVVYYDLESKEQTVIDFEDNRIYSILIDEKDELWAGSWGGGLFNLKADGSIKHYNVKNSNIENDVIYSLYKDTSDILWVGTNGGGLYKSNPRKENHVIYNHDPDNPNSITPGKITKLFEDDEDNLWVAVYNRGLNVIENNGDISKYGVEDGLESSLIKDIVYYKDEILLGTGYGLVFVDQVDRRFNTWNIIRDDLIIQALEVDGDNLWIGTYGTGLYHYDGSHLDFYGESNSKISNDLIYDIHKDQKNRLWIGTNDGLNLYEEGQLTIFNNDKEDELTIASNVIQVIYEAANGQMWFGTDGGGLSLYKEDGTFESFTERDHLASNAIVSILEDEQGRLLLATDNGISSFEYPSRAVYNYTPSDGIGGWEFSAGHLNTKEGELLFTGVHGIIDMVGSKALSSHDMSHIYITDLSLFQKSINENQMFFNDTAYTFDHNENNLSFDFSIVSYERQDQITYYYKLDGFDQDWVNSGNRNYATYSNIPSGTYDFQIKAEMSTGELSDIAQMTITINKPWYLTIYAFIVYIIVLLIIIYVIIKVREANVMRRKNSQLNMLNDQLEEANEKLENMAILDPLTGAFNRRFFEEDFEEKLQMASRSNTNITMLLIDIDNFKDVNDLYGHLAGDAYLRDVTDYFKASLHRKTDYVVRYGGDEFAIVLYDTDQVGAKHIAESVFDVKKHVIIQSKFTEEVVAPHISIGVVTCVPSQACTRDKLISKADEALYKAKSNGRNQIVYN